MAEQPTSPALPPLADGVVPKEVVARTERRWLMFMVAMLAIMLVIVVLTSAVGALHPASNVEVIEPQTLHLGGEFAESNLGTAIEPDGSATVRIIAEQYDFVPNCVEVPVEYAGEVPPDQRRRGAWLPAARNQRQYDGGARLRRRSAHQVRPYGRVRDAVSRILRARSSRHVDTRHRRRRRNISQVEGSLERTRCARTVETGALSLLGRVRLVLAGSAARRLADADAQPAAGAARRSECLLRIGDAARDGDGLCGHHLLRHGLRLCRGGDEPRPSHSRRQRPRGSAS